MSESENFSTKIENSEFEENLSVDTDQDLTLHLLHNNEISNKKNQNKKYDSKKSNYSSEYKPRFHSKPIFVSPYDHKYLKFLDKFFSISQRGTDFKTEIVGGFTMFLSTIYILQKQPEYLSETGMDKESVFVATALVSGLATITVGLVSGLPLLISTGMGENLFFINTICNLLGYSWQTGLSFIFLHGLISLILSFFISNSTLIYSITTSFRIGISIGIALFIAKIGLRDLLSMPSNLTFTPNYNALIGYLTLGVIVFAIIRGYKYFFVIAIILSIIISLSIGLGLHNISWNKWNAPTLSKTAFKLNFKYRNALPIYYIIIYVIDTFFDVICSVLTLIQITFLSKIHYDNDSFVGFVFGSRNNKFMRILIINSVFIMVASFLGTSPTCIFIESCVASVLGAKTGLSSVVAGLSFLFAIFFYPIISIIPRESIGGLLVYTGVILLQLVEFKVEKFFEFHIITTSKITEYAKLKNKNSN
ncbi:xanthine/uracil permease [Anaeramoeba ignava]|uniref:Xanthine/uracil permease n=1 Tax=Anaeramoeba ignava TaxID=1746090 RepID=A0A9Q0LFK5_ANAIG|nr:xanthine/uracil permease [Anaeramoeba ignava]